MTDINRRSFVKWSVGASAALSATRAATAVDTAPAIVRKPGPMKPPSEIRRALTGPVSSIGTPFRKDGEVDYRGLRRIIDACIAGGSKTMLLTVGDSHYICLSDDEIAEVTKVTCQHTAGRAMVVAADRYYSTKRAVDFAKFARQQGADVVMCLPPDWGGSGTEETLAAHYIEVARHAPVMIVTGLFISRGAEFGLKTIKLALDGSKNIVAIKDDFGGEFVRRLCLLAHERCALFAGGQKQNHLDMWLYGCDGYMSTFIGWAPSVTRAYWSAIEKKDIPAARRIIAEIDIPFFKYIIGLPGGFDAGIHGIQELYGLAGRWRRKPYYSLSDAELESLKTFLATLPIPSSR